MLRLGQTARKSLAAAGVDSQRHPSHALPNLCHGGTESNRKAEKSRKFYGHSPRGNSTVESLRHEVAETQHVAIERMLMRTCFEIPCVFNFGRAKLPLSRVLAVD